MIEKIQLSLYKNAKDNKGSITTLDKVLLLLKDKLAADVQAFYRTSLLSAVHSTKAEFDAAVAKAKKWDQFIEARKVYRTMLAKYKQEPGGNFSQFPELQKAFEAHQQLLSAKGILQAIEAEDTYNQMRERADHHKRTSFKAVTFSGTFTSRNVNGLGTHSQLLTIDVDKLSQARHDILKQQLAKDSNVVLLFTSPGGEGLKIIFRIDTTAAAHIDWFTHISDYLKKAYGIEADPSGKDVSRLCFIPYDPDYYYNADAMVMDPPAALPPAPEYTPKQLNTFSTYDTLDEILKFTEQHTYKSEKHAGLKAEYIEGQRNAFINLFGYNCSLKGIPIEDCIDYAKAFANDLPELEVINPIKSVYASTINQFGKYAKRNKNKNRNTGDAAPSAALQNGTAGHPAGTGVQYATGANGVRTLQNGQLFDPAEVDETQGGFIRFWSNSVNEKTGKETIQLNYTRFFDFLQSQGFFNLKMDGKGVELVRMFNGVVDPVIIDNTRNDVKTYINSWCKSTYNFNVLEMLHRGEDKYFARKKFINLDFKTVEFLRDDKDRSFYFHSNCVVEVTRHGVTTREYEAGEKAIWQSQIIDRPFTKVDLEFPVDSEGRYDGKKFKSEFARYQCLAASSPNKKIDPKIANQRFEAHATSFGYLVNGFKPSDGKAIVAVDHKKAADRIQQNGRTGKGLYAKGLGYVKKRYNVDGRKFDPKDSSVFDAVTMDVKIITVTDCHPRFDFGYFFVPLTEDFSFRKLYVGHITIPYEHSPKWYFDTNFAFAGDGASFEGRQHIIEFDDYFNSNYKPQQEFGHSMWIDWDEEQWNLFYNYCYWCDQLYKTYGLIEYPGGNYLDRKLINEVPEEFVDWMDATECLADGSTKMLENGKPLYIIRRNKKHQKIKDLFNEWNVIATQNNMNRTTAKTFTKWLKKYCDARSLTFITRSTGGMQYVWISDGTYPEEKLIHMGELPLQ